MLARLISSVVASRISDTTILRAVDAGSGDGALAHRPANVASAQAASRSSPALRNCAAPSATGIMNSPGENPAGSSNTRTGSRQLPASATAPAMPALMR